MIINNIIGQKHLLETLDRFTIETLPHSIILNGKSGSGKHLIGGYIANKFNYEYTIIDDNVNIHDFIESAVQSASIKFYLIEANFLSEKNQNALLKFAEEPNVNVYLIFMPNSLNSIIGTLKGRCHIFNIDKYSRDELATFTNNELLLTICETPGEIIALKDINVQNLINEIYLIFNKIKTVNLSYIFKLSEKIEFSDKETDKLSYKYFINLLIYVIINILKVGPTESNFKAYQLTQKFYSNCLLQCDKKRLYEKFLIDLMEI